MTRALVTGPREGIYGNKRYAKAKSVGGGGGGSVSENAYASRSPSPSNSARIRASEGLAARRVTSASSLGSRAMSRNSNDPADASVSIPDLMQFMAKEGHTEAEMAPIVQSLAKLHILRSRQVDNIGVGNVDYALPESPQLTRAAVTQGDWAKVEDVGTDPVRLPPDYSGFRGGRRRMTEL